MTPTKNITGTTVITDVFGTENPTTQDMLDALATEAELEGANPQPFADGAWVGVVADQCWITQLGYDKGPWSHDAHPRDPSRPLVVPHLVGLTNRVVVETRSVTHHNPPIHNGAPQPPQTNSARAVVAFIPRT